MGVLLKAPPGHYRIVGVDTFAREDHIINDLVDREEAIKIAKERGGSMYKTHVYDDMGRHIAEGGKF